MPCRILTLVKAMDFVYRLIAYIDLFMKGLLTLRAHAQRGLSSVRPLPLFLPSRVTKKRYKRVQRYTGLIFKMAVFQKRLRSGDMA